MSTMTDPDGIPIVAILYDLKNDPFTVFSSDGRGYNEWIFEVCEKDAAICYHCSGCGGGNGYWHPQPHPYNKSPREKLWLAPNTKLNDARMRRDSHRATNCPRRFRRGGLTLIRTPIWLPGNTHNPFNHTDAKEGEVEYCMICKTFRDVTDNNNPCEHLTWNDDDSRWTGPGVDE